MYQGRSKPTFVGEVVEFDDAAGLGAVEANGHRYRLHCIEIADGSRTIDPGQAVAFELLARFGAMQAANVRKLAGTPGGTVGR